MAAAWAQGGPSSTKGDKCVVVSVSPHFTWYKRAHTVPRVLGPKSNQQQKTTVLRHPILSPEISSQRHTNRAGGWSSSYPPSLYQ